MTPDSRERIRGYKRKRQRPLSPDDSGYDPSLSNRTAVTSFEHSCGSHEWLLGLGVGTPPVPAADAGRCEYTQNHLYGRGDGMTRGKIRSCFRGPLGLLILAGTMSSGECDSTSGAMLLRRRHLVRIPEDAPATSHQGDTGTIVHTQWDIIPRGLDVPCETAECKKKKRRRRKKRDKAQKKREAKQRRRRRRRKKEENESPQAGVENISKGLPSPLNVSFLPLGTENVTSAVGGGDADGNATLPNNITRDGEAGGDDVVNNTTPTVPIDDTGGGGNNDLGSKTDDNNPRPPQPPSFGGISAKPQHRCTASLDDVITEAHCSLADCLYDETAELWNDDNCPGDQVCVYANICVAKLPTFPDGIPEGLQLAPAGGPGPAAAAAGRSSPSLSVATAVARKNSKEHEEDQTEEAPVTATHVRRPHVVSLDRSRK